MEPVTATLMTAKEIYEAAKTIQKVYNVSKEMKTVAESEGKDQIMAAKDLAGTTVKIKQEGKQEKKESLSKEIKNEGNLYYEENDKSSLHRNEFVDNLKTNQTGMDSISDHVNFVDKLSCDEVSIDEQNKQDVFVDKLCPSENVGSNAEINENENRLLHDKSTKEEIDKNPSDSWDATDTGIEKSTHNLTESEKQEIKEKTGWSDKIVDAIRTKEEANVYIDAGLVEGEVNGKPALLQPKIDGNACNEPKWPDWSNKDLAEEGYPPRDKDGRPYELHHIGQNPDSPLAELTYDQHHSNGNFKVLHTFEESTIDRIQFNNERKQYWIERSKSL